MIDPIHVLIKSRCPVLVQGGLFNSFPDGFSYSPLKPPLAVKDDNILHICKMSRSFGMFIDSGVRLMFCGARVSKRAHQQSHKGPFEPNKIKKFADA